MSGWVAVAPALGSTARMFEVTRQQLEGPRRWKWLARARFVAALVLRWAGLSYPEIGHALNKDHKSVMHGVKRAAVDVELLAAARAVAAEIGVEAP